MHSAVGIFGEGATLYSSHLGGQDNWIDQLEERKMLLACNGMKADILCCQKSRRDMKRQPSRSRSLFSAAIVGIFRLSALTVSAALT